MFRHARIHAAALTAGALGALGFAAPALAARGSSSPTSGGASLTPATDGLPTANGVPASPSSETSKPQVQRGNVTVSDSGAGLTLSTTASAILRRGLNFTGSAPAADAGRQVVIERLGHQTGWRWQPTVQTTVNSAGGFSATWSTNHIGEFAIRAVLLGSSAQPAFRSATMPVATAAPTVLITVYRPSVATWYGPGFFGRRTACGKRLRRGTLGVANRTLKCGEQVALYYRGRTLVVPVVDRGPYANGADWDLTEATSRALGIRDTVRIGAVSLPAPPRSLALS